MNPGLLLGCQRVNPRLLTKAILTYNVNDVALKPLNVPNCPGILIPNIRVYENGPKYPSNHIFAEQYGT